MRNLAAAFGLLALSLPAFPQESPAPLLRKGGRVAVVGDSITEQRLYSKYVELYLTACLPELELRVLQLGWSGETAPGFANRMNNDLLPWKPDVVTTCYGMNDGGYRKYDESIGKRYRNAMADIVGRLKKVGATVVVGSPGAVDFHFFKNANAPPPVYNENLARLRDHARRLAEEERMPFADVHGAMIGAMEKAKPALGDGYDVCGRDGFHPGPNGHLLMAYAFLKALGVDGRIGTVTVDLQGGAESTAGHKVLSCDSGRLELESARWPFCFSGDEKSSAGTRSIVPFVPFNEDLNRFVLVVKNLGAERGKVTWGNASKEFPRRDLERGVNLAEHFADTPFSEPFRKLEAVVAAKQQFETVMVKSMITAFPRLLAQTRGDKRVEASLEALRLQFYDTHDKLGASARSAVLPVKHALAVSPVP
jgi:lysophospholipase L1-like esterase